ncbi:hypothetical protein WA026_007362 [Henosepilachna vigintioctopunctata]|uniref:Zasp-like motif domain-containing protein n=1 Tax=Henosepilachna vigintioctopunctata TaxID=420089 RepID=A0AAW1UY61_9CUCU
MMANQPRLVNKQFNSPIGLYSQQNIQEVLHRDMQVLTNGGVGINFYNPGVGKPANLQNSAVLRMLEEESRHGTTKREVVSNEDSKKCSKTEQKKPIWPPPDNERKRRFRSAFKDVVIPGTKRVAWPPLEDTDEEGAPKAQQKPSSSSINSHPPEPRVVPTNGNSRPALKPLNISCNTLPSQQSSRSPVLPHSPKGYGQSSAPKGWAPVHSPVSPKGYSNKVPQNFSPEARQYSNPAHKTPQSYSPVIQQYSAPVLQSFSPSVQEYNSNKQRPITPCHIPNKVIEPPPATITLRPQAPVSQAPPPVFTSQPATATFKGGKSLRGDLKWPPETVKQQAEEENRLRMELARGPVFRPRKVNKDYSNFFAQHALNSSYPGYRAPPGTQYYGESDY